MMAKKVYFNDGQRYLMYIGANTETIIAARRFGKSDGIIAPRILRNIQYMPRSAGAFYAATFQQALTRTIPAAVHALSRWGYKNEVHYWIGRRAPEKANFKKPYINPSSYEHIIHFYNGSIIHILSQDVKFSANSLTLDYLMMDEGRSIKKDKLFSEAMPALSGIVGKFDNCPWHKGITMVSDMPQGKEEQWLIKRKDDMDEELIKVIEGTLAKIMELRKKKQTTSINDEIKRQEKALNFMRKNASIYREFDALDNLEILGEAYIAKMKRELTPIIFHTAIMNRKIGRIVNGFYANLGIKHYYDAFNNTYLNNLRTNAGSFDLDNFKNLSCLQDSDINADVPLHIALDYNANINWIVTGQPLEKELRTLKSMFVKNQEKLRALLTNWCDYYEYNKKKEVVYYFDSTALDKAYADEQAESFRDIVISTLTKRNWTVYDEYIGQPMKHNLKHQYIDDALTGRKYLFPMFNRSNNEFLLPAMENTGIRVGRNGFEKDKSGEKYQETEEDLLEMRTDGTDAWDTFFIGCNFFPVITSGRVSTANLYTN